MIRALIRLMSGTVSHLVRPITRPATLFLVWTQRYTIGLWSRSLLAEARHQWTKQGFDPRRAQQLLRSLVRVSSDPRLANAPDLRKLTIDQGGDVIADAAHDWHGRYLLDLRVGMRPVAEPFSAADVVPDAARVPVAGR